MIRGYCRTNLDDGKCREWPKVFVAVPRIGERVCAPGGGVCSDLKVVGVTHTVEKNRSEFGKFCDEHGKYDLEPIIIVELNK